MIPAAIAARDWPPVGATGAVSGVGVGPGVSSGTGCDGMVG